MGCVSITRTKGNIKRALSDALSLIGGLETYVRKGDKVMLKPNLNGTEGVTNIELVEGLIQMLLDLNVRDIMIAESAFGPAQFTDMFFKKNGYTDLAAKYQIPLINLNHSEIVEAAVPEPLIIDKIKIAREAFDADRIINLPVMKVHYATAVTLALKNLKGLLVGDEKRRFHETGLDRAIVDLNSVIRPALHIVDGITCMEGMGPRGGDLFNLNLIIAGADPAEVDYTGIGIMDFTLDEVKHLKYYVESNKIDLNGVEVLGEKISGVKRPFRKAALSTIVPEDCRIHDRDACSSCMNALLLSLQVMEKDVPKNLDIYLGTKVPFEEDVKGLKIGFGNCCPADPTFDKYIKGCPPYPFALGKALKPS